MAYDYDLVTIGAGSGGVAASRRAGAYGARVAICEEGRVGGTCVLRGCVPKKLLVHASHVREEIEDAAGYGWTIPESHFDWPTLIANKNTELDRLEGIYNGMLSNAGVETLAGRGVLVDAHTVDVGGRTVTAERVLVATGGWPEVQPFPGREHVISSNEALDLPSFPERVVIAGGGYIAVEFAGIFSQLGAEVTILIRGDHVLRGFDHDLRLHLEEEMTQSGVAIHAGCKVTEVRRAGNAYAVDTTDGATLAADAVLFATGRKPNTAGIGLAEAGVVMADNGAIVVDEDLQTTVPGVYAIGDCTDRNNLTPVAIAEGRALAETWFNGNPQRVDYADIATAVFSQPTIGTVGLTEEAARLAFDNVDIYRSAFRPLKNTLSGNPGRTMMKLVVDRDSDRVLGCHLIGADAPEIVQGIAIALKCGATKAQFDATMAIHPTAAEELVTMYMPVEA
ncbi:MAG: glutathione-disulfide reductase [Alphaproteobacteria bacterium]|nr:glutathione-disulfide reductase [Alphaproteobacteria bacterium]